MFIEEIGQIYQIIAPVPPWFHYLVSSQEAHGTLGFTLGVLLAMLYVILKVLIPAVELILIKTFCVSRI